MGRGTLVATHTDLPWLRPGSTAEVWLDDAPVPHELSTSAFAFPFEADGRMLLANVLKRGPDIPGGHIDPKPAVGDAPPGRETPEEAAVREAAEETGAEVRILGKVGHLRIVVPDAPPGYRYPPTSFQPFYAAAVEAVGEVRMKHECGPPIRIEPEEAAADPRFRLHASLILAAAALARGAAPDAAGPGL